MNISKAKLTVSGNIVLSNNDKKFLFECGEQMLDIREERETKPDLMFSYIGEQCAIMSYMVDNDFIIEVDFNNCLEQDW